MKPRSKLLVLPIVGILLFAVGTYASFRFNRTAGSKKYFYWSSIRLDRDPLNRHSTVTEGRPGSTDRIEWEPESVWVDPGWLAKVLILSALPAFLIGRTLSVLMGHFGVSQLTTFIISVPVLMFVWYYLLGWIVHRLLARLGTRNA